MAVDIVPERDVKTGTNLEMALCAIKTSILYVVCSSLPESAVWHENNFIPKPRGVLTSDHLCSILPYPHSKST